MRRLRISFALAAVMALTLALPASAGGSETVSIGDEGTASIVRTPTGVAVNVALEGLEPGNAITVWFVHFAKCEGPCTGADLALSDDSGVIWSQIGGVVGSNGQFSQGSFVKEGEDTGSGHPDFTVALGDAEAEEIHLVVQDHGPALTGDDLVIQTTTFLGNCNPTCTDPQFAVFLFPTA
jgi:hypothetical protein